MALKHVYYHVRIESPVYVRRRIQHAWGWYTGMTQKDVMGREVGGGFMFGNACTPMVDSCQCMAKPIINIIKKKLPTSTGSSEKAREFQKNIYFCFTDYAKALDCVDHNKLWKILKEMGIPDHLTCLLRNVGRSGSNSYNWTWNNRLVPNWERSTSRLYIVTLLI